MNFEQATRVFSESEIVEYRGSYPREIETYLAIRFPIYDNEPTKMEKLLTYEKSLEKPKPFPEIIDIIKSPITEDYTIEDLLMDLHEVAMDCNASSTGDYSNYIHFLIKYLLPFKTMQHDIAETFDLNTSNTTPYYINHRLLCKRFVLAVDEADKISAEELAGYIVVLIQSIYHCDNVSLEDNLFTEYIKAKCDFVKFSTVVKYLTQYKENGFLPNSIPKDNATMESSLYEELFESCNDVYLEDDSFISDSRESMITLFGENIFRDVSNDEVIQEIRHLNRDTIESYISSTMKGTVDFQIDPQFKIYLQKELDCKMMVSQVKRDDQVDEITMVETEGERYVLFTLKEQPDEIYGISMCFKNLNPVRKLITIYRNDDVSYQFVDTI